MESRAGTRAQKADGLAQLVAELGPIKEQMSKLKKQEEKLVASVKKAMAVAKLTEYTAGGYKASITTISNDTLNEEVAINVLRRELADDPILTSLIKTKEYLDQAELETAVYNHKIPDGMLATATEAGNPTVRLSCTKQKDNF